MQEHGLTAAELGKHVGAAATQTPIKTTAAKPGFHAVEPMAFLIRGYSHIFGPVAIQLTQPFRNGGGVTLGACRRSAGAGTDALPQAPQRLDNLLTSVNLGESVEVGRASIGPLSARNSVNGAKRQGPRGRLHCVDSPRVRCIPSMLCFCSVPIAQVLRWNPSGSHNTSMCKWHFANNVE